MNYLKISFGVFIVLASSRFVPYNFTSLIALSFYVPAIFGVKFIPIVLLSFFITDFFIGMHSVTLFTWGSVLIIGLVSKFFLKTLTFRILGVVSGTFIFFIVSNFGVWLLGGYTYNFEGFIACYVAALPFYGNTLVSTLIFSSFIEIILKLLSLKKIATIK